MKCDTCQKDFKKLKTLKLVRTGDLCESCFDYVILDEINHVIINEGDN